MIDGFYILIGLLVGKNCSTILLTIKGNCKMRKLRMKRNQFLKYIRHRMLCNSKNNNYMRLKNHSPITMQQQSHTIIFIKLTKIKNNRAKQQQYLLKEKKKLLLKSFLKNNYPLKNLHYQNLKNRHLLLYLHRKKDPMTMTDISYQ